ncbi:MAG: DNA primase DnaG [Nanoarchaeota archaeon]
MGKISLVSSKYIVNASIEIDGVVDRPDVIGAIFGQTEGLLGSELELRELQRSGRIGRIEVNTENRNGKTAGAIIIPSSLDKAETAIIAAALEIIQRIGPCNAKVHVQNIEDVRISKRNFVLQRAKELLRAMMDTMMPDSTELAEEVITSVRSMECIEYGRDRLPAGPGIDESEEVIVVEGRADVINLLKAGFKNVIAMNGTSVPATVIELSHKKDIILFVDGDRGGNLIIRDMLTQAEVDFVTKAPDGKEVEELAKKEIHKALRSKITAEQAKHEIESIDTSQSIRKPMISDRNTRDARDKQRPRDPRDMRDQRRPEGQQSQAAPAAQAPAVDASPGEKTRFREMMEELIGTKGAYLLDSKLTILGKVPLSELATTIKSLNSGIYAVVLDGSIDTELASLAERANVRHLIGMDSNVHGQGATLRVMTAADL